MRSKDDDIDGREEHAQGNHVPGAMLQGKRDDEDLSDEVEAGTNGHQARDQGDVADWRKS